MAFSLRKMISNIGYFKRSDCDENGPVEVLYDPEISNKRRHSQSNSYEAEFINLEPAEPDSTSIQNTLPNVSKPINFTVKKGHSDTDLVKTSAEKKKKRTKKLKLDIQKANQSLEDFNIENTPKHILLESKSSEIFSERMKLFGKSIDFSSDSSFEEDIEIESLTDDNISLQSTEDKLNIKMCRKVKMDKSLSLENVLAPSATPESFGDVEETEDNVSILLEYQKKFTKMEDSLKSLLADFQFHIEVSKIFDERTPNVAPPNLISDLPKLLSEAINDDATTSKVQSKDEAKTTKYKLKHQLLNIQKTIDEFINQYLVQDARPKLTRSKTFDLHKGKRFYKTQRVNSKKKIKHYDFPDIRDAMIGLFSTDVIEAPTKASTPEARHICQCECHEDPSETDSGLTTKEERSFSITSSIGNFSLDASALSAYSESLDQNISYVSYQDSSLYSTMLQKVAMERLTFYVQAHSIQIKCEASDDLESKNCISFYCPSCKITEYEENCLLKHILSQGHCEKIHFLYKTAYIKKCVAEGKEIMPSTVLNPMKMYRDDNKVVCFGDAVYACSLCFVNPLIGESVLMAHCSEDEHLDRKDKLSDIIG